MIKSILFFLIVMTSCNSSKVTPEQSNLNFDVILERATGGRIEKEIVIISDQNALKSIYNELNLSQEPSYEVPIINFETELAIVFFMGQKNTGGHNISVKSINESEKYVILNYEEKGPKPTDMVTMVITQPYCLVKIKKPSKELKFTQVE